MRQSLLSQFLKFPPLWRVALVACAALVLGLYMYPSSLQRLLSGSLIDDVQARPINMADWETDFSRFAVPFEEIRAGGPPRDGIPAIDNPQFVSPEQAAAWLAGDEPVIALRVGSDARAYPLQILIWHEIVNDAVGSRPVAVTFCPLCNASLVFDRNVGGQVLDFGTTGLLRKSDMVMYDRQTESWWQQFTGEGIVGHYMGTRLREVPSQIVSFAEFRQAHPRGRVLSRDTGHVRAYGRNPYRGYDRIGDQPFALDEEADPRLPAMERIVGVTHGDRQRAYPFLLLEKQPVINDRIGDLPVVVMSRPGLRSALDTEQISQGRLIPAAAAFNRRLAGKELSFVMRDGEIVDEQTGSTWNLLGESTAGPHKDKMLTALPGGIHFAFAWLVFYPETEIHRPD